MKKVIKSCVCLSMVISLAGCSVISRKKSDGSKIGTGIYSTSEELSLESLKSLDIFSGRDVLKNTDVGLASKTVQFYNPSQDEDGNFISREATVYFIEGSQQVPYMSLDDLVDIINTDFYGEDETANITTEKSKNSYDMARENGAHVTFDLKENKIYLYDYDEFISNSNSASPTDHVSLGGKEENSFITHMLYKYIEGNNLEIDLSDYGLHLVKNGDEVYCPVSTFSDLFIAYSYVSLAYNGQDLFFVPYGTLSKNGEKTPYGELYYSVELGERSEFLINFNYSELCLAMDFLYGLKEEHDITSFNEYAYRTELRDKLLSSNPEDYQLGLYELTFVHLGDNHSAYNDASPYAQGLDMMSAFTSNENMWGTLSEMLADAFLPTITRTKLYPDGNVPMGYTEIGDTAFITFDAFVMDTSKDYTTCELENDPDDTVMLVLYAHEQITRENSPIKNVVMNLSANGGGMLDAASIIASWYIGLSARFSMKNMTTMAEGTTVYTFDANRDGEYDDKDILTGYDLNLYCVTTNGSFSCGNLTPALFKSSGKVTILGKTSGGGTCVVQPFCTADGAFLQISGQTRISTAKNGSFYSVDRGVDPDIYFANYEDCFDNEAIVEIIHDIY